MEKSVRHLNKHGKRVMRYNLFLWVLRRLLDSVVVSGIALNTMIVKF